MEYKEIIYYILGAKNNFVHGVICEDDEAITYYDMTLIPMFNQFTNREEMQLLPYPNNEVRTTPKSEIHMDWILGDKLLITKDYWVAFQHAAGTKISAITTTT